MDYFADKHIHIVNYDIPIKQVQLKKHMHIPSVKAVNTTKNNINFD